MVFRRTLWKCEHCGHEHPANREQCIRCGYVALEAVETGVGPISRTLAAALPALLTAVLMALIAVVLFL